MSTRKSLPPGINMKRTQIRPLKGLGHWLSVSAANSASPSSSHCPSSCRRPDDITTNVTWAYQHPLLRRQHPSASSPPLSGSIDGFQPKITNPRSPKLRMDSSPICPKWCQQLDPKVEYCTSNAVQSRRHLVRIRLQWISRKVGEGTAGKQEEEGNARRDERAVSLEWLSPKMIA